MVLDLPLTKTTQSLEQVAQMCYIAPPMELTLILRDVPVKDDDAYKVLYSLCPRRIIYSVDFGIRAFPRDRDLELHTEKLNHKVAALRDVVPFNGASEISPLFSSYLFGSPMPRELRGHVAGEAFRIFTGIKRVYFDMGIAPQMDRANDLAESIWMLDRNVEVSLILPISVIKHMEYIPVNGPMRLCPFLPVATNLKEALEEVEKLPIADVEVFCAHLLDDDKKNFFQLVEPSNVKSLVFWSTIPTVGIDLTQKECKEEKPPEDEYVPMRALYTAIVWDRKSPGGESIGHLNVHDVVKVKELPINTDGTSYGRIVLGDGRIGYVVTKHNNVVRFDRVEVEKEG